MTRRGRTLKMKRVRRHRSPLPGDRIGVIRSEPAYGLEFLFHFSPVCPIDPEDFVVLVRTHPEQEVHP
ncbi:hypothetical protein ABH19_03485 [Leptospirillum sp. Group II 'CF-1']|nr:hypothetical protein ABH19_03485 [Leptospirillum sp. Group II 'CF-1']